MMVPCASSVSLIDEIQRAMHQRVLINCKWQTHRQMTGVQRYASQLTNALVDPEIDFDRAIPDSSAHWKSTLWEQRTLPKLARLYDTLLCPANMAPLGIGRSTRLILTVHCLRFHHHPENYTRSFVAWYRFMIPKIIERADTVLTVSKTTADEIQRVYPCTLGKIRVIYPGVSRSFGINGSRGDPLIPTGRYFVYIGNAAPAKNLRVVLDAMRYSKKPHRLVLLGVNERQLRMMSIPYRTDRVLPLGHMNNTQRIGSVLRGATGLVAPSLYESFDLPTVEAMACGCPVIASDTPVHHEVAQDAPSYVPALDAPKWAQAMDHMNDDAQGVQQQRIRGIERAAEFRWDKAASEVVSVIRGCALQAS